MLAVLPRNLTLRAFAVMAAAALPAAVSRPSQVGADDHAGQDAQAAQPDLLLFAGGPLLFVQGATFLRIRHQPPVAGTGAGVYDPA